MKLLILLMIFLFSVTALSQERTSAVLIDEFGSAQCDDMLARIDNFSIQLYNDLTAKGLVVISGSNEYLIEKLKLEILLTSGARRPGADVSSRLTVIRANEAGKAMMRFWLVPAGAEAPEKSPSTWNLTIPKGTKPFYFHSDSDQICSYGTVYKYLRELLTANPGLRINVVVSTSTSRKFKREVKEIQEALESRRIRFFRLREVTLDPSNEFWLLP